VPSGSETVDDTTFIYVAGGRPDSSGSGYLATIERAAADSVTGALGPWEVMTEAMVSPRAFFVLLTNVGQRETPTPPPPVEPPCEDLDGDGHEAAWCGGDDCDDTDPTVYPGAPEICGDGIDQNCDGIDPPCECETPDGDGDGHERIECGGDDCNDADETIYPGADDPCGDDIDQNCDGIDPECECPDPDVDGDGHARPECGGDDCDDTDPTIYPGADEICDDGIDQDCDGFDQYCPPIGLPFPSIAAGPVYLIACQGDETYSGAGNQGRVDIELAEVLTDEGDPNGDLGAWRIQSATLPGGQQTHGHGAELYFDFAFIFGGVATETLGLEPQPSGSATTRFEYNEAGTGDQVIRNRQSVNVSFVVSRSYYDMARLMSFIYAVGGNDGFGAISSIERIHQ